MLARDREIGGGEHRVEANPERGIGERRIARADVGGAELARDGAGEQIAGAWLACRAFATRHHVELRQIELCDLGLHAVGPCAIRLCRVGLDRLEPHRIGPCEPAPEQIGPVAEAVATTALTDLAGTLGIGLVVTRSFEVGRSGVDDLFGFGLRHFVPGHLRIGGGRLRHRRHGSREACVARNLAGRIFRSRVVPRGSMILGGVLRSRRLVLMPVLPHLQRVGGYRGGLRLCFGFRALFELVDRGRLEFEKLGNVASRAPLLPARAPHAGTFADHALLDTLHQRGKSVRPISLAVEQDEPVLGFLILGHAAATPG